MAPHRPSANAPTPVWFSMPSKRAATLWSQSQQLFRERGDCRNGTTESCFLRTKSNNFPTQEDVPSSKVFSRPRL